MYDNQPYLGEYPDLLSVPEELTSLDGLRVARHYNPKMGGYSIRCALSSLLEQCTPEERESFAEENPNASIDYAPPEPENVVEKLVEAFERHMPDASPEEYNRYSNGIQRAYSLQVRTCEDVARLVTEEKTIEERQETIASLYL